MEKQEGGANRKNIHQFVVSIDFLQTEIIPHNTHPDHQPEAPDPESPSYLTLKCVGYLNKETRRHYLHGNSIKAALTHQSVIRIGIVDRHRSFNC